MSYGGRFLPVAFVLCASVAAPAAAQDPVPERAPAVSSSVTADFLSHYVWRGVRLSDGLVLQPSVGVETHGLSVNLWWNVAGSGPGAGG